MKIVGYCRLSKDDGRSESSSITNQKKIIQEYADNNGFKIDEFLCDDGFSGYTFSRPAFDKLKVDVESGDIDIIIVKDLSRIGRHNAKVNLFLENITELGKRVISISEGYDTLKEESQVTTGIYTWANENYVRETSKKVRKSIEAMQKQGSYISCVPYGYVKDTFDKTKYYVDETCAMYVKQAFEMYINGMGCKAIAKQFTKDNVPTGRMITKQRLERIGKTYNGHINTQWSGEVIQRMIQNSFYIGTLTLNKTTRRSIKGKKVQQSKDKYYVFENAHEPIIDVKTFYLAQQLYKERKRTPYRGTKVDRPNPFTGVLYCADCGKRLTSTSSNVNTRYVCRTYNKLGTEFCSSHAVLDSYLSESLITFLSGCRTKLKSVIGELDFMIKQEYKTNNNSDVLQQDLTRTKNELKVLMEQKMRETMKNPSMADMIDNMYNEMMNEKYAMISSIEKQLEDTLNMTTKESEIKNNLKSALNLFDEIINSKELTKKQVLLLVDKIVVHEDNGLDIYLKGDLHELYDNTINVRESLETTMDRLATEYILSNKQYLTPTGAWKHAVANGVKIGFIRYNKYFSKFIADNMVHKIEDKQIGYEFIIDDEILEAYTSYNTIANTTTGRVDKVVTLKMVFKFNEFAKTLSKGNKHLF